MTISIGDETLTDAAGADGRPGSITGETLTNAAPNSGQSTYHIDPTNLDPQFPSQLPNQNAPDQPGLDLTTTTDGASSIAAKIIKAAKSYLGVQYLYGGNGYQGIDCSGLTRAAYAAAGIQLPRVSFQQANYGKEVSQKAAMPGDLVAWDDSNRNPGADHIALYLGNGYILESPHPGEHVRIRKLGSWDQDANAWFVRVPGVYH